jgi:hypothetical protein
MPNQNISQNSEHASNTANQNHSTGSPDSGSSVESKLSSPAAGQLLKFSVPRTRVALVTAAIFWATEDWFTDQAIEPDLETITVLLAPDTLSVVDLVWVLSNLPGCFEAALHAAPVAAFTGDPKRTTEDLKRPPDEAIVKRCTSGVIGFIELMEDALDAAIESTALLQFGLDINEAHAKGHDERADRLCEQSLASRGAMSWELMTKLRNKR